MIFSYLPFSNRVYVLNNVNKGWRNLNCEMNMWREISFPAVIRQGGARYEANCINFVSINIKPMNSNASIISVLCCVLCAVDMYRCFNIWI